MNKWLTAPIHSPALDYVSLQRRMYCKMRQLGICLWYCGSMCMLNLKLDLAFLFIQLFMFDASASTIVVKSLTEWCLLLNNNGKGGLFSWWFAWLLLSKWTRGEPACNIRGCSKMLFRILKAGGINIAFNNAI